MKTSFHQAVEGHAPSWPPSGTETDATERVPPERSPAYALEGHAPSWPRPTPTDATERVPPRWHA